MANYILFPWSWLKSRFPHSCENWQQFLGNMDGGVIFCSMCARVVDKKSCRSNEASIRYDYSENFGSGTSGLSRFKFTEE